MYNVRIMQRRDGCAQSLSPSEKECERITDMKCMTVRLVIRNGEAINKFLLMFMYVQLTPLKRTFVEIFCGS